MTPSQSAMKIEKECAEHLMGLICQDMSFQRALSQSPHNLDTVGDHASFDMYFAGLHFTVKIELDDPL